MKTVLSSILIFLLSVAGYSQITFVNDIPDLLVTDHYFFNENYGIVIGVEVYNPQSSTVLMNSIRQTYDGGVNLVDRGIGDQWYDKSTFNAITFLDSQKGFAVGGYRIALWREGAMIYKTLDGGITWSLDEHIGEGRSFTSVDFPSTSTGYICGFLGDIYKTSNGGVSWLKMQSPTTSNLHDIKFKDDLNGYVVGDGVIYKTNDGGTSWQQLSLAAYHSSVALKSDSVFVAGDEGLYFSVDGGLNWIKSLDDGSVAEVQVNIKTGEVWAVAGNKVFRSGNGVQWDYCDVRSLLNMSVDLTSISLLPQDNCAYMSDITGKFFKISDLKMTMVPYANFQINKTSFCANEKIDIINNSPHGCNYKWFYNGNLVSTSYQPIIITDTTGGNNIIRLDCDNGVFSSSLEIPISVMPIPKIADISITVPSSTFCFGSTLGIGLANLDKTVSYQFLVNGNPYGALITNMTAINYNISGLSGNPLIQVKAIKITACDTAIRIFDSPKSIVVNPLPIQNFSLQFDSIVCVRDSIHFSINNFNPSYRFELKSAIGGKVLFTKLNANSFNFSLNESQYSDRFFISLTDNNTGCSSNSVQQSIVLDSSEASFSFSKNFYVEGDSIAVVHASNPKYLWQFSDGIMTSYSNAPDPKFYGQIQGVKTLKLITVSAFGCKDSTTKQVSVVSPQVFDANKFCDSISFGDSQYYTGIEMDYCFDQFDNKYVALIYLNNQFSNSVSSIIKYDKYGNELFQISVSPVSKVYSVANVTSVDVDDIGNIYVAGMFNNSEININGVSRYVKSSEDHGFLAKFDSKGNYLWIIYSLIEGGQTNHTGATATDVKVLNSNRIFVSMKGGFSSVVSKDKYVTPHGDVLHSTVTSNINILEIDSTGKIVRNHKAYENAASVFNSNFTGSYNIFSMLMHGNPWVVPKMKVDKKNGMLFICGSFIKSVTIGSKTLVAGTDLSPQLGQYFAKIDVNGSWVDAFMLSKISGPSYHGYHDYLYARNLIPSFDVDSDGNIYYSFDWNNAFTNDKNSTASLYLDNQILPVNSSNYIVKYNSFGKLLWYKENNYYQSGFLGVYNDKLIIGGTYNLLGNTDGDLIFNCRDGKSFGFLNSGLSDAFVMELDTAGNYLWSRRMSTPGKDWMFGGRVSACGKISFIIQNEGYHKLYNLDDFSNCASNACYSSFNKTVSQIGTCEGKTFNTKFSSYAIDSADVYLQYYGTTKYFKKIPWDAGWYLKLPDSISTSPINVILSTPLNADTIEVSLLPMPIINLPDTIVSCGSLTNGTYNAPNGYSSYDWTGSNYFSSSQTLSVTSSGLYKLSVTQGNSCSASDEMFLKLSKYSNAIFSSFTVDYRNFNFIYDDSTNVVFCHWDLGDGTSVNDVYRIKHLYSKPGKYDVTLTTGNLCDTVTIVKSIIVNGNNEIVSYGPNDSISVFPNPFFDHITINIELSSSDVNSYIIEDVLGKKLFQNAVNKGLTDIDLVSLPQGVFYIVFYRNDKQIEVKKIIKRF